MTTELLRKLMCIHCNNGDLQRQGEELVCYACGKRIALNSGIPDFFSGLCVGKLNWDSNPDPAAYELDISKCELYRLRRIDEPLLRYVRGDVLEIGCGTCRLAPLVEKLRARYFGLDSALPFLQYARARYGLNRLVWGRGEKLPFQKESFDCLISGYYAYRFVNPDIGLPQAHRVLKKGGIFVFDILNYWFLKVLELRRIIRYADFRNFGNFVHFRPLPEIFEFMSIPQLKQKVESSGFLVEKIISTPFFPLPLLSRLNKYLSAYYYRGNMVYLGYDVIVVLKAV